MPISIPRGESDAVLDRIVDVLREYETDHPDAQIDLYRQNRVSVRVRIVDLRFAGRNKVERSRDVWVYLDRLPDDVQSDLSAVILLTPDEREMSIANFEFDHPVPSNL